MIKMEKIYRFGWYALILAMTGDILVSLVLPCLYEEYSSMKKSISALGNPGSPVRIPFNIWMLMEGMMFLVALPALYKRYYPVSAGLTYTVIAFTAIFAVGACIFTCFRISTEVGMTLWSEPVERAAHIQFLLRRHIK